MVEFKLRLVMMDKQIISYKLNLVTVVVMLDHESMILLP